MTSDAIEGARATPLSSASPGTPIRVRRKAPVAVGALALGAAALGALAVGAIAIGAGAIGRLAVGRLTVGRAKLQGGDIGELRIARLTISELRIGADDRCQRVCQTGGWSATASPHPQRRSPQ
jgi:hypothetical protein